MPPHCDTLDGPVVRAARRALEAGNVDIVLPYVTKAGEAEIVTAFEAVMKARAEGLASRAVADRYFFETVVRVHRAGEGAPYTGLKPAGLEAGPVIPIAERAIESGASGDLLDALSEIVRRELAERFEDVMRFRRHQAESVAEARAYVRAMLGLQVWAHEVYLAATAAPRGEGVPEAAGAAHHH